MLRLSYKYLKVSALFILVLVSSVCHAQHNHGGGEEHGNEKAVFKYSPQHGGEIADAGKFKLEIVTNPMQKEDKLLVYVLKKNYKEIELKEATANITLKYKDGKSDSIVMQRTSDHFATGNIDLTQPVNIFFQIQIGTKTITATYYYEGLNKH